MASPPESPEGPNINDALQEIIRLRKENAGLVQDLDACKDQLFELMRKENDIPEHSVKEAFASVFDGIESWIDELSSDENFDTIFKAQYLQNLKSNSRREDFSILGLDPRYLEMSWTMKLGKLDTCHFIILSLVIARCVTEDIIRLSQIPEVGGPLPFGLPSEAINLVKRLQHTMSTSLKRDEIQIARWRGETMSALVAFEDFDEEADNQSKETLRDLVPRLQFWIGKGLSGQQLASLRRNVIDRASKALQMISCSKKRYALVMESVKPGPIPDSLLSWNIKDVGSWSKLPAKDAAGVFHCIYPGLTRKGANGQNDLPLVVPTLLGCRDPYLQPTVSSSRTPSPRKQDQKRIPRDEVKPRNCLQVLLPFNIATRKSNEILNGTFVISGRHETRGTLEMAVTLETTGSLVSHIGLVVGEDLNRVILLLQLLVMAVHH
ncbi:hypothetical protein GQ53DRAFT_839951 [Thozetella sp. PMI_491]|nr:hypothetical protein GQ53DRAFT_839951 [Thozetella sp. PMI_491]